MCIEPISVGRKEAFRFGLFVGRDAMMKCPLGPNSEYQLLENDERLPHERKSYLFEGILRSQKNVSLMA